MRPIKISNRQSLSEAWNAVAGPDFKISYVFDGVRFDEDIWHLPNSTPGAKKSSSTINWRMRLLDGTRFTDDQHADRLLWCKKLVASLLLSPTNGLSPAPGSMGKFPGAIRMLFSWMSYNGYRFPHELTPTVIEKYVEDLPELILSHQDHEEISESQVMLALFLLPLIWRQRKELEKHGYLPMPHDPFYSETTGEIARRIANKLDGWIKPLPDEVAVPLFNKSVWFLEQPAEDVIRLVEKIRGSSQVDVHQREEAKGQRRSEPKKNMDCKYSRRRRTHNEIMKFSFGIAIPDSAPWHPPLRSINPENEQITTLIRVRQLFDAIRDACAITVQGTTGMRISELLGIKAGIDSVSRLPRGIRIEDSISGLYEIFLIRTTLSKTVTSPRDVDWILGMRPKGSNEIPLAVRALEILNKLYSPWQRIAPTDFLFLGLPSSSLPLGTTVLKPLSSEMLSNSMKRFISRWVDLSDLPNDSAQRISDNDLVPWRESRGAIFTSHMLRKSWANFTLAVNPRLLPAIQMQFHHLSLAMTDSGYIGRNPLLVEPLESMTRQKRNLLIFEMVTGRTILAGRMGEQIERATADLHSEVVDLPSTEAWKKIINFCDDNQVQIFFSPHGKCCPIRTSEMRCQEAAGMPHLVRREPNYGTREPSLCAGCACFVLDAQHQPFWEDRYLQNWISYRRAEAEGLERQYQAVRERAEQAGSLLRKLGVDTQILDEKILRSVEKNNAWS